jgi:hypothetical protein
MIRKRRSFKRAIPAIGLALLASLALSAAAAGSASAATQHWHSCKFNGGAKNYTDSACSKETFEATGSYGLVEIGTGPQALAMNGTSPFTLKFKITGISVVINCSTQSGNGTFENPSGKAAGTAQLTFLLEGCAVAEPSNCTVKRPEMGLKGVATEFGGKPAVKFSPTGEGETILEISFEGAKCGLNGVLVKLKGSFTGIQSSSGGFEFTEASSALTYGSAKSPVSLTGTSKLANAAGEALKLAP